MWNIPHLVSSPIAAQRIAHFTGGGTVAREAPKSQKSNYTTKKERPRCAKKGSQGSALMGGSLAVARSPLAPPPRSQDGLNVPEDVAHAHSTHARHRPPFGQLPECCLLMWCVCSYKPVHILEALNSQGPPPRANIQFGHTTSGPRFIAVIASPRAVEYL